MSVVTIAQVKAHLRVFQNADDGLIQMLLDGAEDEAKQFLDRDELPRRDDACAECHSDSSLDPASDSDDIAPTVRIGIFLLVQATYEGTNPDDMIRLREAALAMLRPYRCRMGV